MARPSPCNWFFETCGGVDFLAWGILWKIPQTIRTNLWENVDEEMNSTWWCTEESMSTKRRKWMLQSFWERSGRESKMHQVTTTRCSVLVNSGGNITLKGLSDLWRQLREKKQAGSRKLSPSGQLLVIFATLGEDGLSVITKLFGQPIIEMHGSFSNSTNLELIASRFSSSFLILTANDPIMGSSVYVKRSPRTDFPRKFASPHIYGSEKKRHNDFMIESEEKNEFMDGLFRFPGWFGLALAFVLVVKDIHKNSGLNTTIEFCFLQYFDCQSESVLVLKKVTKNWSRLNCGGIRHQESKEDILQLENLDFHLRQQSGEMFTSNGDILQLCFLVHAVLSEHSIPDFASLMMDGRMTISMWIDSITIKQWLWELAKLSILIQERWMCPRPEEQLITSI